MIGSWRVALRIARREALRARGRTALVFCMVALPVAAVVAIDTLARTSDVTPREGLRQELGTAAAVVRDEGQRVALEQDPLGGFASPAGSESLPRVRRPEVLAELPGAARLAEVREDQVLLRTPSGAIPATAVGIDTTDPLLRGVYRVSGRRPDGPREIAVTARLAERGFPPGSRVRLAGSASTGELRVVGILRGPIGLGPLAVAAAPETLGLTSRPVRWFVESRAPVEWEAVQALNALGLTVLSRAVVEDPPPQAATPSGGADSAEAAVLFLVVAMALLQVALLAGPAFAVGARRQRRALALLAATGGTPRDVRRVVLAGGVAIGAVAALAGAVAGVLLALAVRGVFDPSGGLEPGPFEVNPRDVALIAAFGLLSAVLAALAPAISASRADVVAVLAGRRGETRRTRRSLTAGLLLFGGGAVAAGLGAQGGGELAVAFAAVPVVLGAILLAPALLERSGRLAHRLPLPARLAVRDAARQRARTAPAVAAVAATVAGVVALGIGASSDASELEATYTEQSPLGTGVLVLPQGDVRRQERARAAVGGELPLARLTAVRGVPEATYDQATRDEYHDLVEACPRDSSTGCAETAAYGSFGSQTLIGAAALPWLDLPAGSLAAARRTLAAGGALVFSDTALPADAVLVARRLRYDDVSGAESKEVLGRARVPVLAVPPPGGSARAAVLLSDAAASELGVRSADVALVADGASIGQDAEERIGEALTVIGGNAYFRVERGPDDGDLLLVLLLLGGAGGALLLGGTLTATLLALSEARPDFATLQAVGAAPAVRRAAAACYSAVIGLSGALLGTLAGLVVGIAVAFPLTDRRTGRTGGPEVFVTIPWPLLAALVLGVPLLAAVAVGLSTRGRVPLTYRPA